MRVETPFCSPLVEFVACLFVAGGDTEGRIDCRVCGFEMRVFGL